MGQVISSFVSKRMAVKEVMHEVDDSVGLVRMMAMQEPDMEDVAMTAWSEVEEAGMIECAGGKGGKRRLEGDKSNNRSMQLVSQAWRTILGHDGKLNSLGCPAQLCKQGSTKVKLSNIQGVSCPSR